MRIRTREARADELPFLQFKTQQQLPDGYEPVNLKDSVVYLAEDDGLSVGLVAAHLGWQIEPLILFPEFERYAPRQARKRATYLLGKAITEHLADGERNRGLQGYFAHVDDPVFAQLAEKFGMFRAYEAGLILKGGRQ